MKRKLQLTKNHPSTFFQFFQRILFSVLLMLAVTAIYGQSIGNRVWEDLNANGIQDFGEPGLAGVYIFLEDENGIPIQGLGFEVTDANGNYLFEDLPIDKFIIRFATPGGFQLTSHKAGSDNSSDSDADPIFGKSGVIDLTQSMDDLSVDAGYYRKGQVFGIAWSDDEDGIYEDEDGVNGVIANLYDAGADLTAETADDVLIAMDTTRDNGFYEFQDLDPGFYFLKYTPNSQTVALQFTTANAGSDDYFDSDADETTGVTPVFEVTSNEMQTGIDVGLIHECGIISDLTVSDDRCEGYPVDFEVFPDDKDYEYEWSFYDDAIGSTLLGTSADRISSYTWSTAGTKLYEVIITNTNDCAITLNGTIDILAADDPACSSLLPVEFVEFNAKVINGDQVALNWSTAWEENNQFFEVQRLTDNDRFETIGVVNGNGYTETFSQYQFIDEAPLFGRNYYRLKQVDFNGSFDFSEVVEASINGEGEPDVIIYPNPTKAATTLRAASAWEQDAIVEIVNSAGVVLEVIQINTGTNNQEIDLSKYQPGFYFLNIKYDNYKNQVHRVLKLRD